MHCLRLIIGAFCCTLLILSCAASSKADAPKAEQSSVTANFSVTAYLDYTPFDWEDFRATTRQELLDGLHEAIRVGLDKAQAADTYESIVQLNDPAQIDGLKALLRNRHNMLSTPLLSEPRLLLEADGGRIQLFVTASGIASQGSEQWRLSAEDFTQLKQMLDGIYGRETAEKEMSFKDSLSVYYLPLHSATYIPVTEESIISGKATLLSPVSGNTLLNLLQRPVSTPNQARQSPKIDTSNIRLRIEETKGEHLIFVDSNSVVDDAGQTYKLTPDADKKLSHLLNTLEMERFFTKPSTVRLSQ